MTTWSVSSGSESKTIGFGLHSTAKMTAKGYVRVTGVKETRYFMLRIARDYKTYNSWMKQGAQIVANESRRLAPVTSGKLARSLVGRASARVVNKLGDKQTMFGGVVVANTPYGKSVSFGRFYPSGPYEIKRSKTGAVFHGYRANDIRSNHPNTYMKRARENTKPNVVQLWNNLLKRYLKVNGFEYHQH